MLTIICGEDIVASRNYLNELKNRYKLNGYDLKIIVPSELDKILLWMADSPGLFSEKKFFICERLNKFIRKGDEKLLTTLKEISKLKNVNLIIWEDISNWELKLKKIGMVKEFKPSQTIFKLQDSLCPGNKINFINFLNSLSGSVDENFIFIMLVRLVRNLIIIKEGFHPNKMQSWQLGKLQSQVRSWKTKNLINYYEALFKIEIGLKSGTNPYSIKDSLTILACHFL